jgi:hypothetical protein
MMSTSRIDICIPGLSARVVRWKERPSDAEEEMVINPTRDRSDAMETQNV